MVDTQLANSATTEESYYRSHLYTSYTGINALITAAHPVLSIIDRLQLSRHIDLTSNFYNQLQYELKVFEGRAKQANYDEETIFIGQFLLSATLNEKLHDKQSVNSFKKLMPPQNAQENTPDLQFFDILDKIIDKPDHYLDLLELIYLCLSLGFEGKYKQQEHHKLKDLTEKLYQNISDKRQNTIQPLFSNKTSKQPTTVQSKHRYLWIATAALFAATLYCASNWYLDKKAMDLMTTPSSLGSK